MQLKLSIISEYSWLETLLKQYFTDIEITTQVQSSKDTDIIIDQSNNKNVSIKMLTHKKSWLIPKPISISAIINIIEQAISILSEKIIIIGPVSFCPDQKLCKFKEETIELTQKETEILLYLEKHPEEVNKTTLLNEIWGYSDEISTHTLETHIYKLRNKFSGKHDIIISKDSGYALAY